MKELTPTIIQAEDITPQPWRNGSGQTRELLTWPPGADWQVRISRADIAADGPFSAYAGVQRWFAVLEGVGVRLHLPNGPTVLRLGDAPVEFDGASAPQCTLLEGPTQDLNLMTRNGNGLMYAVTVGKSWQASHAMRGLYTSCAGTWSNGTQRHTLAPHSLLWNHGSSPMPWSFEPHAPSSHTPAWWLGFTPAH